MPQLSLFKMPSSEALSLPDGEFHLHRGFLGADEAQTLFEHLLHSTDWAQDDIRVYGKRHPIPRLHAWFSDEGTPYSWSGLTMKGHPWTAALSGLRDRIEAATGVGFNSALANLYRDGQDTVGWHADDEAELGPRPTIASLSLGAERVFMLRHRDLPEFNTVKIPLPTGSLFVMGGASQRHWLHSLPRRAKVKAPRINLTFRLIAS